MIDEKYQAHIGMLEDAVQITKKMGIRIVEMGDRHVKVLLRLCLWIYPSLHGVSDNRH